MRKLLILLLFVSFAFSQSAKKYWLANEPDSDLSTAEVQSLATFAEELYAGTIEVGDMSIDSLDAGYLGITNSFTLGGSSIKVTDTYTQILAAAHKSILSELTYTPQTAGVDAAGTACPIAIVGKVNLDGDLTAANSYPGLGWGVQGQIHVATGSTIDGSTFGSPGAVYAGLRGVITGAGTTTYTKGALTGLYSEIQLAQANANDEANFNIYGAWIRNQGVATSTDVAAGLFIDSNPSFPNLFLKGIDIEDAVLGIEIDATTTGIDFSSSMTQEIIGQNDETIDNASNGSWDFGAADLIATGGDITGANGNAIDIGEAADGTITFSRDDSGAIILTSADDNADADLTIVPGGTGNLLLGDSGGTTQIVSSDWTISTTGVMANIGTIGSGKVSSTGGVDLGTSQALTGTTALTIGAGTETVAVNSSDWNITAAGHMTGIGKVTTDSTMSIGGWGYTGEHFTIPETSDNTNAGLGVYSVVDYSATAGKVFAGSYSRMLAMTTAQTNQSSMFGMESQFRLRDVSIADGVHAGLWAYAEQSGTSVLSGAGTFDAISATVESASTFTTGATEHVTGITLDSSIDGSASIDASTNFSGVYIKSNGKDWYDGIKITGATNDIVLVGGSKIDGSTTSGATHATATGVTNVNYAGALNQTVITFTSYAMPIVDSAGSGGHGTLKLVDFPEGVIRVTSAIGDIGITAVDGIGAAGVFDMAMGSATTLTNSETLANANVDFVAKVDGTLSSGADDIDLVGTTSQDEDGHSASTDVWLCVAVMDTDMTATGTMTFSGTIVITWHNMGDY